MDSEEVQEALAQLDAPSRAFFRAFQSSPRCIPVAEMPEVEAAMAGDERTADELLSLYLSGKKTAGSSLVRDYTTHDEELPTVGKIWIILDGAKQPRCIVKTARVIRFVFSEVTEEVARAEGEGDCTVEYWKRAHREFFAPYLPEWGVEDLDNEEVITEFFEVVYP